MFYNPSQAILYEALSIKKHSSYIMTDEYN